MLSILEPASSLGGSEASSSLLCHPELAPCTVTVPNGFGISSVASSSLPRHAKLGCVPGGLLLDLDILRLLRQKSSVAEIMNKPHTPSPTLRPATKPVESRLLGKVVGVVDDVAVPVTGCDFVSEGWAADEVAWPLEEVVVVGKSERSVS